jgi:hypothetical protein
VTVVELAIRGTTGMEIESVEQLVDRIATLLDAFGHPVRLRIMAWAYSHPDEKVSAKRQSDVWGLPLGRVAYHVRKLHDTKLLYAAGTARRRGYCPDCDDYTSAPTPPGDIVERVRARYGREAAESVRRVLVEDR